ncbi:ATP-binding protein [Flavobacterium sp. FPG59]|jgi:light-regulated signal transduction histidine kinase (bacteriophytochrome)|uniref:sensor histidine kinase n=1 Tax=Flavobacterium sp. FPG59 TaxID=1929267 RepID=UPI000A3BAA8F|nr:ATP-binding protein [Flavobacterium sp. FPG59]OUD37463.1 two-component sensor histidine kinase [Flavobacterium sp. FPG59]
MHSLLKRQIDKKLAGGLNDLDIFLNAVNDSYQNYESQIEMLQRAMKISSDELFEANQKLRDEAKSLKELNENLQSILDSMSVGQDFITNTEVFDSSEYIKQQSIEIVKINKQREELLFNLEKQNKALNEYAHMVSHDLKAPLRSIDTLINWFIQDNESLLNEANLKSLNRILLNVEKMDSLIKGILNYSSIENHTHEERIIDVNLVVQDFLKTIEIPNNANISITNDLPVLMGNDFRLKQLFQNLIQNALKYNDKEHIEIEISSTENEQEYLFQIKDNGIGIPHAYQHKIFDIFSKLQNDDNSSGIGLSIVKRIIEFYKGRIWLESQEKVGTTFFFTIPKDHGNT